GRGGGDGGAGRAGRRRVGLLHLERCFRHFPDVHADTSPPAALDDEVVPPVVAGKDQVAGGGSLGGQDDEALGGGAAHAVALQVDGQGCRRGVTGGARAWVFVRDLQRAPRGLMPRQVHRTVRRLVRNHVEGD